MDIQTHKTDLAKKLSFQVLTGPCRNSIANELSGNTTTGTPFNVKIKLRHKDDQVTADVYSVPKTGCPNNSNKLRLVSSDQTIASFNLLIESDVANGAKKPMKKSQNKILHLFRPGVCLGFQSDDNDYSYMPHTSETCDEIRKMKTDEAGGKDMFGLKKNYVATDVLDNTTRPPKPFLGKCKAGGCLDPPFGEEKYAYESTKDKQSAGKEEERCQQKLSVYSTSLNQDEPGKMYLRSGSPQKDSVEEKCIKTNSLITYPSNLVLEKPRIKNSKDKGSLDKPHNYIKGSQPDNTNLYLGSYYTPSKSKEISLSSTGKNMEDTNYQTVVQYSNAATISRDTILPTMGGPTAPVLPDSVQLSIIESGIQKHINENAKTDIEHDISSSCDGVPISMVQKNTSSIDGDFDSKIKDTGKLRYLESISVSSKNSKDPLPPGKHLNTAAGKDGIIMNKDIIVIAPIKQSTEERHSNYSESEKNLDLKISSDSNVENTKKRSSTLLTSLNTTPRKDYDIMTKNEQRNTNVHDLSLYFSDATDGIETNKSLVDKVDHDMSQQKNNTRRSSNSTLLHSNTENVNEFYSSKSATNQIVVPQKQSKEILSTNISKTLIEQQVVEKENYSRPLDPASFFEPVILTPENHEYLIDLSLSTLNSHNIKEGSDIKEKIINSDQHLSDSEASKLKEQSLSIGMSPYDEVSSILARHDEKVIMNPILSDSDNLKSLQSKYPPLPASKESFTSQKQLSDLNNHITIFENSNKLIHDAEDNIFLRSSNNEEQKTEELSEEVKTEDNNQDVESHKTKLQISSNTQSTHKDINLPNKHSLDSDLYIVPKHDSLQKLSGSSERLIDNSSHTSFKVTSVKSDQDIMNVKDYLQSLQSQQLPYDVKPNHSVEHRKSITTDSSNPVEGGISNLDFQLSQKRISEDKGIQFNYNYTSNVGEYKHNSTYTGDTIENKSDNKYKETPHSIDETHKRIALDRDIIKTPIDPISSKDNDIYVDLALNIHKNKSKHKILKTYDSDNTPEALKKSQLLIKSTMGADKDEIRIPIDPVTDFVLQVRKTNLIDDEIKQGRSAGANRLLYNQTRPEEVKPSYYSNITQKMFEETITSIYEQNLVPVENMIRALNKDVKVLVDNQKVIRQMLKINKNKSVKTLVGNRKCGCSRGMLH